jgi:hypothetical protein
LSRWPTDTIVKLLPISIPFILPNALDGPEPPGKNAVSKRKKPLKPTHSRPHQVFL